jgi:threonylcarbamoyladenosine tRNA methylthiotransferase MtaB
VKHAPGYGLDFLVPGTRFAVLTLGCKVNQYESQALCEAWSKLGLLQVQSENDAELVLINSCAVTSRAVQDLRAAVRRVARECPEAKVVVTGCAAQLLEAELSSMEQIDILAPQKIKPALGGAEPSDSFGLTISRYPRSRAVLKVQDGCSHHCTYCVVPGARGPSRSREPGQVVAEARRLLDSGVRELTLAGINLRQYGMDIVPKTDFWDLLSRVQAALAPEWQGRARLRISSLDPSELGQKSLDVLAGSTMICPHLHLSLQSGSPSVLGRMNRGHYDPALVPAFLDRLRASWPVFGLGADILTGFPGESEEEAGQTLELCAALPLSYAHVFPYSQRPSTPAARYPDQVPHKVRRERAARVRELVASKRAAFLDRLAAEDTLHLVMENERSGRCGQYVECRIAGDLRAARGELIAVQPLRPGRDHLVVTPIGKRQEG